MVVPCAKNPISPGAIPRAISRRARDLLDHEVSGLRVEQHEIGMGPADVDPEPIAGSRHAAPPVATGMMVMPRAKAGVQ
jgi:hypothetical protein